GHPLHAERAYRAAAHVPEGRAEPEPDDGRARAGPAARGLAAVALTRRQLLAGGVVGGAVASGGLYALVDQLSRRPRRPAAGPLPPEQHVLHGQHVVTDNGVEVLVPPLHHEVVTACVRVEGPVKELKGAQAELEYLLISIER